MTPPPNPPKGGAKGHFLRQHLDENLDGEPSCEENTTKPRQGQLLWTLRWDQSLLPWSHVVLATPGFEGVLPCAQSTTFPICIPPQP